MNPQGKNRAQTPTQRKYQLCFPYVEDFTSYCLKKGCASSSFLKKLFKVRSRQRPTLISLLEHCKFTSLEENISTIQTKKHSLSTN